MEGADLSMLHHAPDEGKGRLEGLGSTQGRFHVDDALPLFVVDLIQTPGHGGLEAMLLDGSVSPDCQGRESIAALLDIGVDGFRQGGSLRSCFGPFASQVFSLDGPGLPDAGCPVWIRHRDALAAQPQLDKVIPRWELARLR